MKIHRISTELFKFTLISPLNKHFQLGPLCDEISAVELYKEGQSRKKHAIRSFDLIRKYRVFDPDEVNKTYCYEDDEDLLEEYKIIN